MSICQLHILRRRTAQISLELHFCVELHTKKVLCLTANFLANVTVNKKIKIAEYGQELVVLFSVNHDTVFRLRLFQHKLWLAEHSQHTEWDDMHNLNMFNSRNKQQQKQPFHKASITGLIHDKNELFRTLLTVPVPIHLITASKNADNRCKLWSLLCTLRASLLTDNAQVITQIDNKINN